MVENILLITIDSLRADHFPSTGRIETSTFTSLNEEGTSFTNAFATGPGTTSSFPALLTGTLPLSFGGLGPLSADRPRVAKNLKKEGFTTAAFHSNPFLSTYFNYDEGFEIFKDYQNPLMGVATKLFPRGITIETPMLQKVNRILNITSVLKRSYQTLRGKPRPYVSAEVITDDVVNWLENTDEPFFCWTHYMDVHHPCFPPADIRQQFGLKNITASQVSDWYSIALETPEKLIEEKQFKKLYEAAIVYTDKQIGRIVNSLKSTGKWEETLVVLTSDHGELFGEYGSYGKPIRMYDELLRVPLVIINGPEYIKNTNDRLFSLLDIPPIFHDVLNGNIPDQYEGNLPEADSSRSNVLVEHQVDNGIVLGARSHQQIYEYNELQDERGFFEVAPGVFDRTTNEQGNEHLQSIVLNRLDTVDPSVNMMDLEEGVEERLEDLGYM